MLNIKEFFQLGRGRLYLDEWQAGEATITCAKEGGDEFRGGGAKKKYPSECHECTALLATPYFNEFFMGSLAVSSISTRRAILGGLERRSSKWRP